MQTNPTSDLIQVLVPYAAALTANDSSLVVAHYHDDATIHYAGHNPFSGTVQGKSALLEVFKQIRQRVNRKIISVVDVLIGQEFGIVIVLERWEQNGSSVELERLFKFSVKEGKLYQGWAYERDQDLVNRMLSGGNK